LRYAGSPKRPITMLNLGNALRSRYESRTDPRDIDAAVAAHRDALSAPGRSWWYGLVLGGLAGDLLMRFGNQDTAPTSTRPSAMRRQLCRSCRRRARTG
jgi:hypothetical protein